MNRVQLLGFLGTSPQLLVSKTGHPYTRLSLAIKRSKKNEEGGYDEVTDWHRVQVFGKQAEVCCSRLDKGSALMVEGYLSNYKQEHETLGQLTHTSVVADHVHFFGPKKGFQEPAVESRET